MEFLTTRYGSRTEVEQSMAKIGEDIEALEFRACYETRGHREPPEVCSWMIYRQEDALGSIIEIEPVGLSVPHLKLVVDNSAFAGGLAS